MPLISICIPAYKNAGYLKRLLESIAIQTFMDFEVVICDDSNDDSVSDLVKEYSKSFTLTYKKNIPALGTPENWNECIRNAKGQWIKIMHDDDWFASVDSLQSFNNAIINHTEKQFFFSAYSNIYAYKGKQNKTFGSWSSIYLKKPFRLLNKNVIGPPSVTIFKAWQNIFFDKQLKWLVDTDFYFHYLKKHSYHYINQPLINIGIHPEQVTVSSFRVPQIEIPEHMYFLKKIGTDKLNSLLIYDTYWRLLRNLKITEVNMIVASGYKEAVPEKIKKMILFQRKIPTKLLAIGVFSKITMLSSYFISRLIKI